MTKGKSFQSILFDIDGTLLDTAPDLAFAMNSVLAQHQKPPVVFDAFRGYIYGGSNTMLQHAFEITTEHPEFNTLKQSFLHAYHECATRETQFFPDIEKLLDHLDAQQIPWGIVTNKPGWLTKPIVTHFKLDKRAGCIIAGDALPTRKPDPAQLIHACNLMNLLPQKTIYVGDTENDIIAAKAAGMKSIAVSYGYRPPTSYPEKWGADYLVSNADDIVKSLSSLKRDMRT